MNLDELRTVQTKERQKDSLQHLRDSFYEDAADYLADLRDERSRAAERAAEPFSDPEVSRLSDEIETAEDVVEAIYERRVGKVVKLSSFAAADMPVDDAGLTRQEQDLFDDLVARIRQNKDRVHGVLGGTGDAGPVTGFVDDPGAAGDDAGAAGAAGDDAGPETTPPAGEARVEAEDESDPVDVERDPLAADDGADDAVPEDVPAGLLGEDDGADGAGDVGGDGAREVPPDEAPPGAIEGASTDSDDSADGPAPTGSADRYDTDAADIDGGDTDGGDTDGDGDGADSDGTGTDSDGTGTDRTTVRITADVGQILGMDDREYDLATDDVVTLPQANADALLQRDAAERLD